MPITEIPAYPAGWPDRGLLSQVVPFTYTDGMTYQTVLFEIVEYIKNKLTPSLQKALDDQIIYVDSALAATLASVAVQISELEEKVELSDAELRAYVDAQVQLIINDSVQVQDPVAAGIFGDPNSQTRGVTDALYASKGYVDAEVEGVATSVESVATDLDNTKADVAANETAIESIVNVMDNGRLSEAAIASTIERIGNLINVVQHGANPNGAVDATAALKAAFAQAKAEKRGVLFPLMGNFLISDHLILHEALEVYGYGATIHRNTGDIFKNWENGDSSTTAYSGYGNITLQGLTFDTHGDQFTGEHNTVTFSHAKNITLRDLTWLRSRGFHALELNGVKNVTGDNLRFFGYAPGSQTNKEGIQIDYCGEFTNSGAADGTVAKDIHLTNILFDAYDTMPSHLIGIGSHSANPGIPYTNITVDGYEHRGCTYRSIVAYYWVDSYVRGANVDGAYANGVRIEGCKRFTVSGSFRNSGPTGTAAVIGTSNEHIYLDDFNTYGGEIGIYLGVADKVYLRNVMIDSTQRYAINVEGARALYMSGVDMSRIAILANANCAIRLSTNTTRVYASGVTLTPLDGVATNVPAVVDVASSATLIAFSACAFLGFTAFSGGGAANVKQAAVLV